MFTNVELKLYDEYGNITFVHKGSNIWVDAGSNYLRELVSYSLFSPLTTFDDRRILYLGFGIGGNRQSQYSQASNPPMSTHYPGTNLQTDTDGAVVQLERPIRITGTNSAPPYPLVGETWLHQLPPPTFGSPYGATFTATFGLTDISYGSYLVVPLSEVGLFLSDADPLIHTNQLVAYDTFDTISKTQSVNLEVNWTVSF